MGVLHHPMFNLQQSHGHSKEHCLFVLIDPAVVVETHRVLMPGLLPLEQGLLTLVVAILT